MANGTTFGLGVNPLQMPLDAVRVREALHIGFDVDVLVQSLYEGQVQTAKTIVARSLIFTITEAWFMQASRICHVPSAAR